MQCLLDELKIVQQKTECNMARMTDIKAKNRREAFVFKKKKKTTQGTAEKGNTKQNSLDRSGNVKH